MYEYVCLCFLLPPSNKVNYKSKYLKKTPLPKYEESCRLSNSPKYSCVFLLTAVAKKEEPVKIIIFPKSPIFTITIVSQCT